MLKCIFSLGILILCSLVVFVGCDTGSSSSSSGCDGDLNPLNPDVITFELPSINPNVAKYRVELIAPISLKSLGVQEGLPGETLVFNLDRSYVYVLAKLSAINADGEVMVTTPALSVDLDWESPNCKIIAESTSAVNGTDVSLDVDCNGTAFDADADLLP